MMTDEEWDQFTDFCSGVRAKNQNDIDVIKASLEMDLEEFDRVTQIAMGNPKLKPSESSVETARNLVDDLIKLLLLSGDEVNVAKSAALNEQRVFTIKQLAKGYEAEAKEEE